MDGIDPSQLVRLKINRLHRRAQRAESEVIQLRRQLESLQKRDGFWKKRFNEEGAAKRRSRKEYNDLWRLLREAEGKYLAHEEAISALKKHLCLRPSFFRRIFRIARSK